MYFMYKFAAEKKIPEGETKSSLLILYLLPILPHDADLASYASYAPALIFLFFKCRFAKH